MKTNMHFGATPSIFRNARELRAFPTEAEEKLWKYLCNNQTGFRFRRQHPLSKFVVDFYCHRCKAAIELDGKIHLSREQRDIDKQKETELKELGLFVMRFPNDRVMNDIDNVVLEIVLKMKELEELRYK